MDHIRIEHLKKQYGEQFALDVPGMDTPREA